MRKTNRTTQLAALLGGLAFALAAAPGAAAQVTAPAGSYRQTCSDIKVEGTKLLANCRGKGATTGDKLLGAGEPFYYTDPLENFHECEGDIRNDNSKLRCSRNPNHPRLKQARAALDYGMGAAFGKETASAHAHDYWLGEMFRNGLLPRFYAGLSNEEAVAFFGRYLARPEQGNRRAAVIGRAFKSVYGFGASPKDLAFWNAKLLAGDGNYTAIVFVERHKLKADQVVRRLIISNAYKKAMGRMPTPSDFAYWQPRAEIFDEIVEAARAYLHSAQGAKDLSETVARALEGKTGQKPTTQQINEALVRYAQAKAIYDEM
jgi:hypothetical protein